MQTVSTGDSLHDLSNSVFRGKNKKKKYFANLSADELAPRMLKVKGQSKIEADSILFFCFIIIVFQRK